MRYCRRQKVSAFRKTYILEDGSILDGEEFEQIKPELDFRPLVWLDADTGEEVDTDLRDRLETLYQAAVAKAL